MGHGNDRHQPQRHRDPYPDAREVGNARYVDRCAEVAAKGYEGFRLTSRQTADAAE